MLGLALLGVAWAVLDAGSTSAAVDPLADGSEAG